MRVVLYARVSTPEQDELNQLPALRQAAQAHGWEVIGEYADVASGADANRPQWIRFLGDEARGDLGRVDAIVVVKLDRIMRSVVNLVAVLEDLAVRGVQVITLDVGPLNMSTAAGKLQLQILASVAEWEREIISERTKSALAVRKAKGQRLGRPPLEIPIHRAALLRHESATWAEIAADLGVSVSAVTARRKEIEAKVDEIRTDVAKKGKKVGE